MQHRPLTVADLLPHGPGIRVGARVIIHEQLPSTNQYLLEHPAELGDGTIAWTEYQTEGRGRLGRRWTVPRGSSVLLSVLLFEPPDSALLTLGSLLAAVAACEAIEAATDCQPGVRWPNDLILGNRKLGGVLAESTLLPADTGRAVVIGTGINCLQQRSHFRGELAPIATSLECESHQPVDRAAVAAGVVARLDHWLAACHRVVTGWEDVRRAWRMRCEDAGKRVRLEHNGRIYTGTALEVSDTGDLVVELDDGGRRSFSPATTTRVVPVA